MKSSMLMDVSCRVPGALCTGEKGMGKMGKPLSYKGSKFHRVISKYVSVILAIHASIHLVYQVHDPGR